MGPIVYLPIEYPSGVDSEPGDDPGGGEADEHEVAHLLVVGVLAQLRSLKIILGSINFVIQLTLGLSKRSHHIKICEPPRL